MLNMGGFMERLTGLQQGESMQMLFMLYEAYSEVEGTARRPFTEFLQWAPITLRDMSEMDSHLLDLDAVYKDLRSYQEIEDWSFRLGELSGGQQRLADQWVKTGRIHRVLHRLMAERSIGTSGWMERMAADKADAISIPWKKVWFVGLNAFDPATTKVAKALIGSDRAVMAWDADQYYLDAPELEAGHFLRRSMKDLGPGILPPLDTIKETPRKIHGVALPHGVAQARYAAQMLARMPEEERRTTSIVLADEDLLMPLLEALPASAGPYNVTMGVPVSDLPVHGLVEALLDLHQGRTDDGFYHSHVERLFLHPFLVQADRTARLVARLREEQRSRLQAAEITSLVKEVAMNVHNGSEEIFAPVADPTDLDERITSVLSWARNSAGKNDLVQEQLYQMALLQHKLHQGLKKIHQDQLDLHAYIILRERLLREATIGFFGEPLKGTQIMGFLETRALDSKRVIVLGANDGVLPASGNSQSWIPFELRRTNRLPLHHDSEAITAYHLHRMLHQAEEVFLLYDTSGDKGSTGPTRYLEQWRHELVPVSSTTIEHHTVTPPFPHRNAPPVAVRKDAHVLKRIEEIGRNGFSPSAIGTWLTCPLDFYFKYVLRISEQEEVDEKLGSDVLGAAVHEVLEDHFRPLIGKQLTAHDLRTDHTQMEHALMTNLLRTFPERTLRTGNFKLRIEMAAKALANYLTAEGERCNSVVTIPMMLEEEVSATLPGGMKIRGRCDRIDERAGIIHVLDVKTGSVQPTNVDIKTLDRGSIKPEKRYGLQLLIYAWAYMLQHPEVDHVRAGIIPLQRSSQAEAVLLKLEGSHDLRREQLPGITALLQDLVNELMDPSIPFTHTIESAYCNCCIG
jgi:hypothetical protein